MKICRCLIKQHALPSDYPTYNPAPSHNSPPRPLTPLPIRSRMIRSTPGHDLDPGPQRQATTVCVCYTLTTSTLHDDSNCFNPARFEPHRRRRIIVLNLSCLTKTKHNPCLLCESLSCPSPHHHLLSGEGEFARLVNVRCCLQR